MPDLPNTPATINQRSASVTGTTTRDIYARLARVSFFVFLFFMFFGTSLPFRERIRDVDQIATSNIINQILYSLIFLVSCLSLIPKMKAVGEFIKREKFLLLFLLWCLMSIAWSDYPFVSLKRFFRDITVIIACLAILLHSRSADSVLKYFQYILYIYISLTVLALFLSPGSIDPNGNWRGLAPHKNYLGQIMLLSTIVWLNALRTGNLNEKLISMVMLAFSLVLLLGSKSMTSILTLALLTAAGISFGIDNLFKPLGIGRYLSISWVGLMIGIALSTIYLAPDMVSMLLNSIGKDATFTGRTEFWSQIFEVTKQHLLFGCGFAGFWIIDNANLMLLYELYDFSWFPNQAHNGYLDILNELGIIGLTLLVVMLIVYFTHLAKLKKPHIWKWFLVATLIMNFQESTLFRHGILTGVIFVFCYIALYVEQSSISPPRLDDCSYTHRGARRQNATSLPPFNYSMIRKF